MTNTTADDLKRGRQIAYSRNWIGAHNVLRENIARAIAEALAEGREQGRFYHRNPEDRPYVWLDVPQEDKAG